MTRMHAGRMTSSLFWSGDYAPVSENNSASTSLSGFVTILSIPAAGEHTLSPEKCRNSQSRNTPDL